MPSVSGAVARIAPIANGFELVPGDATRVRNWAGNKLFAALFGGVAVGAEAFRAAMRRLAASGHKPTMAHAARDLCPARLLMREPTSTHALERLDVISGGAISHGLLFALLRVPEIEAGLRIFDHDQFDWPNLNRYLLGRRSFQGENKAELLAGFSRPGLDITYVPSRFDDGIAAQVALADSVAMGVDDIPSRWRVQDVAPGLVVVGATSHFEVVVSEHPPNTACARCLYPDGEDEDGRSPPFHSSQRSQGFCRPTDC
jgi:ThiF family